MLFAAVTLLYTSPHFHHTRQVPIYFSGGMASRANLYYRLLVNWTNEQVGCFINASLYQL